MAEEEEEDSKDRRDTERRSRLPQLGRLEETREEEAAAKEEKTIFAILWMDWVLDDVEGEEEGPLFARLCWSRQCFEGAQPGLTQAHLLELLLLSGSEVTF